MRQTTISKVAIHGLLATLALGTCAWGADEQFNWSGIVAPGQTVEIRNINGTVRADAGSGTQVEVSAVKTGNRNDPRDVRIEVVPHSGGVTICAVYPSVDGRANECRADGGHNNVRDNDVKVEFTVRVPNGVNFLGKSVNGAIEINDLSGNAEAKTVNGRIKVSARGSVQAKTVNGAIEASMRNGAWTGTRSFETVNGGITVDMPSNLEAEVSAATVNGSISTEFPLQVQGKFNTRQVSGRIGNGGRNLNLKTVNGSITLRKVS